MGISLDGKIWLFYKLPQCASVILSNSAWNLTSVYSALANETSRPKRRPDESV